MRNLALLTFFVNLSVQQSIKPFKKQDIPTLTPSEFTDKLKIPSLNDEKLSSNKDVGSLTTQKKSQDLQKSITVEIPTLPILPKSTMMKLIKGNTSKVLSNSTPPLNIADPSNIIKSQKQATKQDYAQKNIVMQGLANPVIKQQGPSNVPNIGFEEYYGSLRKFIVQKAKNSINDTPNQTKIEPVPNIRTVAQKITQNTANSK